MMNLYLICVLKKMAKYMIKKIHEKSIAECTYKGKFFTIAGTLGFTLDNSLRFTVFATTEDRLLF